MRNERLRAVQNWLAIGVCVLMTALAVLPLLAVLYHLIKFGGASVDVGFFTELPTPVGEEGGGLANAIVGSLILVGLASIVGVPLGVVAGIYLARSVHGQFAFWVRYAADVLNGVPTIVIGVVVYEVVVVPMQGFSALSGAVALAIIMLPTVVRTTEEMIKLVPRTLYDAALALGAPEWRATTWVLLRGARAGIITGIMLAAARIAGETAPLLFTSFNSMNWTNDLRQPIASLPVYIYNYAISPWDEMHRKAWAAALVLVGLVLTFSILTRVVTHSRYRIIQ